jgi:prolycopene isomerase
VPRTYDAVVIGAGLGGLAAATDLARHGFGTLLLERHNVPGGYATSFVRGRFELEVALHALAGIGTADEPGGLRPYLEDLGVAAKVEFIQIPELYRSVFPGVDARLPAGRDEYTDAVCSLFPHEAAGIRRFLDRVYGLDEDVSRLAANNGQLGNPLLLPFRYKHLFRYLPVTWSSVLDRDVRDPDARAVLSQYWGYVGTAPSRVAFLNLALVLASYSARKPSFPRGRSQALSSAFIEAYELHGGETQLGCGVERVLVEGGRAVGVVTHEGEEIRARWVVSNCDPVTTYRVLVGDEHLPESFFRTLRSNELAPSSVNVYLGLAKTAGELGLVDYEVFINEDNDLDRHAAAMASIEPPPVVSLTSYNTVYPDFSPPGTSVVTLTSLVHGAPWLRVPAERYFAEKTRIADAMMSAAESVYPGLRAAAEVVEVSTPLTNMRYANTLGGAIYGFDAPTWGSVALRPVNTGPVANLIGVGAWTRPGGGFSPAIMSGRNAAAAVLKAVGKQARHAA